MRIIDDRTPCGLVELLSSEAVQVLPLGPSAEACWDAYVAAQRRDYPYHTLAARDLIARTFGHRSRYLTALCAGEVVGILPLFEMRSAIFGHLLISLPFVTDGGIVADSPVVARKLFLAAERLGERLSVDRVELRGGCQGVAVEAPPGWTVRCHKAKLSVDTQRPTAAIFADLSSRLRGKIRKAEKANLSFSVGGAELLEEFYSVFAKNMRSLGTPVYPPSLFENFLAGFPGRATVLLVKHQGSAAAGAIGLRFDDVLELPWICSDYALSRHNANEFLYWQAICHASTAGCASLELGRSTIDSGPYRFKLQWKPRIEPLEWLLKPVRSLTIKTDADSPRYRAARSIWRKLPLPLTNLIGPKIIRNIP